MFYSGIDLHKDMSFITTISPSGQVLKQSKLPNTDYAIQNYFSQFAIQHKAVVESTSNWYWMADLLNSQNIDIVLAHAKYVKAISYAKVKTDKVDSHTLAQLLRMNLIPVAHQISPEIRGMRDLMRTRLRLVQKKTSCINSIHRLMEKFNLSIPQNRKLQDLPTLDFLNELNLPEDYQFNLSSLTDQIKLIHQQIINLEKSLHPKLIPNPDIQRMLHIPGIGKILAFTIYLEIDGIYRFPGVKNLHSYCRLVPGADNSNRKLKHKSGNKDGNKYLKNAFNEAAIRAVQYYMEINKYYHRLARKKNKFIARTLVAKELAKITYHLLLNKSAFNNTFKGIQLSREKSKQWPRLVSPVA
jgi:transposase